MGITGNCKLVCARDDGSEVRAASLRDFECGDVGVPLVARKRWCDRYRGRLVVAQE